jgi:predicted metal-dependent hydrolase
VLVEKFYLEVGDKKIIVNYYEELRGGARVSITSKGVNLRVPAQISAIEKAKIKSTYLDWAKERLLEKLAKGPLRQEYSEGGIFKYYEEEWVLSFIPSVKENSLSSKLYPEHKKIVFSYPSKYDVSKIQKHIGENLSKVMGMYHQSKISKRLQELNTQYIQKPLHKVQLRNTSSKWGSCSSIGHISISTRLLFAPTWVIDYVLVHELCHLVHMDHSLRFWKLVASIYPRYKEAEKHLKKNGSGYNF